MEDINVKNKGILPERFYIGYAINIGNGVEELERDYLPVALSEYEDGVIFDEISNERVFVGETIDDITSDEFLGLDINETEYNLFVLKDTLAELPRDEFMRYLKRILMSKGLDNFKSSLDILVNSTKRWREYLSLVKENKKTKVKEKSLLPNVKAC